MKNYIFTFIILKNRNNRYPHNRYIRVIHVIANVQTIVRSSYFIIIILSLRKNKIVYIKKIW